ncbi:MAG: UDP-N-acetylmuramate--L-alanine ligase [Bradymonadales bacterium]|nr:MAG: UDP-N-acetylmuramate--L-alanine ligase [Bradymonadales bacterium]
MFWNRERKPHIHMIGIGGSGMSGIAEVLLASNFQVSGSDLSESQILRKLEALGAKVWVGHSAQKLGNPDCVVISTAIPQGNPEYEEALARRIPVIPRAEMLAELMRLKRGIAVAGSHGKTTTTCILGQLLQPLRPTVVVGGRVQHWDASSQVGRSSLFVVEADESDRSFLKYSPVYSIVTNVDLEHLDNYRDLADIEDSFVSFLNRTAFFGEAWLNLNCPQLRRMRDRLTKPVRFYGEGEGCHLEIRDIDLQGRSSKFRLIWESEDLGEFLLPMPGKHNVWNAAAAVALSLRLGVSARSCRRRLASVQGAERRLQIHHEDSQVAVVEDYAHHPTELRAAIQALRQVYPDRSLIVVFQPHRFTRTQALWKDFLSLFPELCDRLYLLPIYAAHEEPIENVSSEEMIRIWNRPNFLFQAELPNPEMFAEGLRREYAQAVVAVLGAGPLSAFSRNLAEIFAAERRKLASD